MTTSETEGAKGRRCWEPLKRLPQPRRCFADHGFGHDQLRPRRSARSPSTPRSSPQSAPLINVPDSRDHGLTRGVIRPGHLAVDCLHGKPTATAPARERAPARVDNRAAMFLSALPTLNQPADGAALSPAPLLDHVNLSPDAGFASLPIRNREFLLSRFFDIAFELGRRRQQHDCFHLSNRECRQSRKSLGVKNTKDCLNNSDATDGGNSFLSNFRC